MAAYTPRLRNFPTEHGKTQVDAETACRDAFSKHKTLQQCKTQAGVDFRMQLEECVEDFKVITVNSLCLQMKRVIFSQNISLVIFIIYVKLY